MTIELKRTLVKSLPELWNKVASEVWLSRWLGDVRVTATKPPYRLEWDRPGAKGVIELTQSSWGTTVRLHAETERAPAWERLQAHYALELSLRQLVDDLGLSSLTTS